MIHANQKPINIKLGVKPVFSSIIHKDSIEGPCRVGDEKRLNPENERIRAKEGLDRLKKDVKTYFDTTEVNILESVYLELSHKGGWLLKEKELKKLEADSEQTDVYFGVGSAFSQIAAGKAGERYKKPVILAEKQLPAYIGIASIIARLRAKHLEGYYTLNHFELERLVSTLLVRKAVGKTKLLRVTDQKFDENSNLRNLDNLKTQFGIDYKDITIAALAKEIDKISQSRTGQKKAKEITDKLIKNAQQSHMKREYIISSVNFYLAVKQIMEKYKCNAFTIDCFEICPDKRVAFQRKAVPCLTHTLLKDEGVPSVCEGDINALLTMMLLMYISKKSAYMGNPFIIDTEKNIIGILHDVPGMKMHGLGKKDLPYEIRPFTYGGWGANIRYDFSRDKGKQVTVATFNPLRNKMLVVKGKIAGCVGFDTETGCCLRADIKVANSIDYFHENVNFSHHHVMVYGDYIERLKEFGKMMGFEVIET